MIRIYLYDLREVRKHKDRPNECNVRFTLEYHTCIKCKFNKFNVRFVSIRLGKERLN